jgi:hypothetical protein
MKQVWKFALSAVVPDVEMPRGAEVLSVQVQRGEPCLWALVDTHAQREVRRFVTVGTGHDIPSDLRMKHVGTFQLHGGDLIFHVFEVLRAP